MLFSFGTPVLHFAYYLSANGGGMAPNVESIISDLAKELAELLQSGENWQVVLHGGRGGDVVMEVKRTRQLAPPRKQQATQATER